MIVYCTSGTCFVDCRKGWIVWLVVWRGHTTPCHRERGPAYHHETSFKKWEEWSIIFEGLLFNLLGPDRSSSQRNKRFIKKSCFIASVVVHQLISSAAGKPFKFDKDGLSQGPIQRRMKCFCCVFLSCTWELFFMSCVRHVCAFLTSQNSILHHTGYASVF